MTASVIAQVVMVLTLLLMITGKTPIYMTAIVGATLSALIAGFPIMGSAEMTIAKSRLGIALNTSRIRIITSSTLPW